jgi:hypothetical protein
VKKTLAYLSLCLCLSAGCDSSGGAAVSAPDGAADASAPDAIRASDAMVNADVRLAEADQRGAKVTVPSHDSGPAPARDPALPAGPPWAGVYDSVGLWDLSGPITSQRTFGDVAADLLVDEIVSLSGVPDALEERATDAVHDLIADKVKATVDERAPADLRPGSPLMMKLAAVLATTEVASTITLTAGERAGEVEGTEEVRSLTITVAGQRLTLDRAELLGENAAVGLGADLRGQQTAPDTLAIDEHTFGVRYGKLLLWAATRVIDEQQVNALAQGAAAAIACDLVTAAILDGKDKLSFGVGFASFSVGPGMLQDGCLAVMGGVQKRALGLFDLETPVQMGGDVQFLDDNGDRVADRLKSKAGGYGGIVAVVHEALAPRLAVTFEARRR